MMARQTAAARYDAGNLAAALAILENPERYGGPDSLMVRWAVLVVERAAPSVRGPLFVEKRAA
jgi:hypothetical protein